MRRRRVCVSPSGCMVKTYFCLPPLSEGFRPLQQDSTFRFDAHSHSFVFGHLPCTLTKLRSRPRQLRRQWYGVTSEDGSILKVLLKEISSLDRVLD